MISLEDFKALLGPLAETLTDEEIAELQALEIQIADAFIAWWRWKSKGQEKDRRDEEMSADIAI